MTSVHILMALNVLFLISNTIHVIAVRRWLRNNRKGD